MIRSRLRLTLLMILAVIIGMTVGAIWLVRSHTARFEHLLGGEYAAVDAAGVILFHANTIGSDVLQSMQPGSPLDLNDPVLKQSLSLIENALEQMSEKPNSPSESAAIAELSALFDTISAELAVVAESTALPDRSASLDINRLADAFRGVGRVSRRIVVLNQERIQPARQRFAEQTFDATFYVGVLAFIAIVVIIFIYWHFNTFVLRPISTLTDSVRQVENRNFELSLPIERDDEIGRLSVAYNDMAAELRRLYRETDEQIVNLNAQNRALLNAFPHAVIVLNDQGEFLQINPEAESILAPLGTPNRLPAKLRKIFEAARDSGQDVLADNLGEALLFRIDEQEHYYLPRVFHLPPVEDTESGWGIILSDVTRFRWLDDMKMNVLATASHEIKTPLTSIRMVLHLLLEQKTGKLSELQEEMVSSASQDCERLLETLTSLLDLARLTRGSEHLDLRAVEPSSLLSAVPLSLQEEADGKHIALDKQFNGSLPLVLADEPRIAQVVTNFLSNAIKFSPEHSSITLRAEKQDADYVRFSVTDHGPGVPPESQDRLFERFYRDPSQASKGTGLGLSISREIIDAHSGRIGFTSVAGSPTTFFFDLPLA